MDERALIDKARRGDEEALTALLEAHGPTLRGRIGAKIGQHWKSLIDEEDVLQISYLEVFLRIGSFVDHGSGAFLAWVSRIAENNLKDAIRELERQKRPNPKNRVTPRNVDESYTALIDMIAVTLTTPSMNAARGEIAGALDTALAKLPEDYERVIRLYDLGGKGIEEVAGELGRSEGAVYMLRARAHERLAEVLGSESKFFSRRS
ncbi:MAG: sigma-70 family RNA polymerase sigma factor [Phycisphaeraceae bacterium]|nr:sigma-70 family RNA polymerase sigma factor [Phycisphaeraceae bacterium]